MTVFAKYKLTGLTPAIKTKEELEHMRKAAANASGPGNGAPVACFFKDPNGADQCVQFPDSASCTQAGGVPVAGNCPGT